MRVQRISGQDLDGLGCQTKDVRFYSEGSWVPEEDFKWGMIANLQVSKCTILAIWRA